MIAGLVHDHVWNYIGSLISMSDVEIVAVADPHKELTSRFKVETRLPELAQFDDPVRMIESVRADICLVFSATSQHLEIVKACAVKKVHVMLEKPMAVSAGQAAEMKKLAEESGIKLMVNFIIGFRDFFNACLRSVENGVIGRVRSIRFVDGHTGPRGFCSSYCLDWVMDKEQNGGGALIDFTGYGALLSAVLLGRPDSVTAVSGNLTGNDPDLEDNAVIVLEYREKGAMVTLEATWAQDLSGVSIQIFGSDGAIANTPHNKLDFKIKKVKGEWLPLRFEPLESGYDQPIPYFINSVRLGRALSGVFDLNCPFIAQEIISAAYRSSETGKKVYLMDL